jgi:hypothetical protein
MIPRLWLLIAEYLALMAAVVGMVVGLGTQQPFWVAPPLTLSLVLNVCNRERQFHHIAQIQEQQKAALDLHSRRINQIEMGLMTLQNIVPPDLGDRLALWTEEQKNPAEASPPLSPEVPLALETSQVEDFKRLMGDLQATLDRLKKE